MTAAVPSSYPPPAESAQQANVTAEVCREAEEDRLAAAFSATALRARIADAQAKLLIIAGGQFRRGKPVPLKDAADEGVEPDAHGPPAGPGRALINPHPYRRHRRGPVDRVLAFPLEVDP